MNHPSAPAPGTPGSTPATPADASDRFLAKRDAILDAAARVINERGLRGLTFVSVAEAVEMNTTSITYYFKRKELLAAATAAQKERPPPFSGGGRSPVRPRGRPAGPPGGRATTLPAGPVLVQ